MKYLVEERGLNLAGVQLALELTRRLRDVRGRIGAANEPAGESGPEMTRRELDGLLAMLGYVDEAEVRARRGL